MSDDFTVELAQKDCVRLGYLIELPWRFRLGSLYRQAFQFRGRAFEVVLQNRVEIPDETVWHDMLNVQLESLWTRALVVVHEPAVPEEYIEAVRNWSTDDAADLPSLPSAAASALEAFNHFTAAYCTASGSIFSGTPLQMLRTGDFLERMRWEIQFLCAPDYELTTDEWIEAFGVRAERQLRSLGTVRGSMADLDVSSVHEAIGDSLSRQESYIHEELVFEAKSKMAAGDHLGALLMAVAALEGVHAAFVSARVRRLAPGDDLLAEDVIRELGMSLCNRATPYLLMDASMRPDEAQIESTGRAIRLRNEVMHALRNKRGEYRIRTRTGKEVSDAYASVLKSYGHYAHALALEAADDA